MKLLAGLVAGLLVLIQYPLWLGKGGWLRVWELDRQHQAQQAQNRRLGERNAALEGEVRDLRQGMLAVEERARYELGMVRPDEVFIQINEAAAQRLQPARPDAAPRVHVAESAASPNIKTAQAPAQARAR